jgi:hypothetical protein
MAVRARGWRLGGALFLAPLAWFAQLQLSYALVPWVCGRRAVLWALAAIVVGAAAGGVALAWRAAGVAVVERPRHFLALTGLGLSLLFFLVIVSTTIPTFILRPCP